MQLDKLGGVKELNTQRRNQGNVWELQTVKKGFPSLYFHFTILFWKIKELKRTIDNRIEVRIILQVRMGQWAQYPRARSMDTLMRIVLSSGGCFAPKILHITCHYFTSWRDQWAQYLASHPRKRLRTGDSKGNFFSLNVAKFVLKNNLKTHWCIEYWIEEIVTILWWCQ